MNKPVAPYVSWNEGNLERHHRKRITVDPGCFEELTGVNPPPITKEQYRQRSLDAVVAAWAEFEAEGRDFEVGGYREARAYYVDDDLVVAVTDVNRREFYTCYHEHFDGSHQPSDKSDGAIGNRQLKYRRKLGTDIRGGVIRRFKPIRGVKDV